VCGWIGWRTPRLSRSNLAEVHTRVANLSSPKKPQKPRWQFFEVHIHKTCTTTHKIDIRTRQKHRYNTSPIIRSIFFSHNYTVVHLFFINNIDHFYGNSKIFAIFCAPCMAIDLRRKRFVMNMQHRQCFARAKPIRLKISQNKARFFWLFLFPKKANGVKKNRISKSGIKKSYWQRSYTRIENAHKLSKKTSNLL